MPGFVALIVLHAASKFRKSCVDTPFNGTVIPLQNFVQVLHRVMPRAARTIPSFFLSDLT